MQFGKTIDHGTLRRLVDAGARVSAEVIGGADGWGVVIHHGHARPILAATRGTPKTWRRFETLAGYLKEFGIVEYNVNAAAFGPLGDADRSIDKRRIAALQRMKPAHQSAADDAWWRSQVQMSIDDPRPSVADDAVRKTYDAKRNALLRGAGIERKASG